MYYNKPLIIDSWPPLNIATKGPKNDCLNISSGLSKIPLISLFWTVMP